MTTQPIKKAQSALDWLCWVLIVFGALCLVASVPQTFTMVRVAHDEFGSAILVVVLEVMAFFALLAPLWVPAWTKTFDRIAYTLLGITTIGNYAGGWNYVWTHNEVGPFWLSIRDWREPIFSLPLATILLVGILSGLVPFAMKFFISLAIKRYRENELDRSPEAVAQRAIEPVLVQIIATRRLQEQLVGLTQQFNNPLVLPGNAPSLADYSVDAEVQRILAEREAQRREDEQRHPFAPLGGLTEAEVAETWQAVQKAQTDEPDELGGYTETELNCKGCFGPCGMCEEAAQPVTEASDTPEQPEIGGAQFLLGLMGALFTPPPDDGQPDEEDEEDENDWEQRWEEDEEPKTYSLDELLAEAGYTREEVLYTLKAYRVKTAQEAFSGLRLMGKLPAGMTLEKFVPLYDELVGHTDVPVNAVQTTAGMPAEAEPVDGMGISAEARSEAPIVSGGAISTWECVGCGAEGTNASKGVAKKWSNKRNLGDKLYCEDCRKSGQYGS